MILKLIPLLVILQRVQCSVVIDSYAQKGIYVSDYCPRMDHCPEGTHVMCMYYDPNRVYGPRCSNPRNVTITPELANQLLDIINAIRSKIANGKETGLNSTKLPRGYGIFRLRWDNELATFAQIFANQCILRHDFCRATKKFSEPGQTAGLVRFTYPGWDPASAKTATGLNDDKLAYSVAQILKSWYSQKSYVTEEMIKEYPNWELLPNLSGRLYLEIIHGSITHMGCGMSAYTEFIYYQNRPKDGRPGGQNYNSIEIICNFSSRPKAGQKTYWTSRPNQSYNGQCGCPAGSQEDDDCLCNEIDVTTEQNKKGVSAAIQTDPETCPFPEENCEPTLVLLPIFTVEDAPADKIMERARDIEEPLSAYVLDRLDNRTHVGQKHKSVEVINFFDDAEKARQASIPHALKTVLMSEPHVNGLPKSPIAPLTLPTLKKKQHLIHHQTAILQAHPKPRAQPEPEPEPEREKESEREIIREIETETDRDKERELERERENELEREREKEIEREHEKERELEEEHEKEREREKELERERKKERALERKREKERERKREKELERETARKPEPVTEAKTRHVSSSKHSIKRVPKPHKKKKSSIFSRAAKFKLPNGRRNYPHYDSIISDVKPRKDFKNMQRVVDDYMKRHNSKIGYRRHDTTKNVHKDKTEKTTLTTTTKLEETTEAVLNNVEEKVMNFNQYLKQKSNASTDDNNKHFDLGYDESDNKLMTLLDTLEREVKHIELDGNEKEIFDVKIRKIYGSVVGKPPDVLDEVKHKVTSKPKPPVDNLIPRKDYRESDFFDGDFVQAKSYFKHDFNNIDQKDLRTRDELQFDDDKNIEKKRKLYEYLDQKYKTRKLNKKDDRLLTDIYDNKSYNENDFFDADQKIFSDIERKYNERLDRNKLDSKYPEDENPEKKYGDSKNRNTNIPAPRNQNRFSKFQNNRPRPNSAEERKARNLGKTRERESRPFSPDLRDDIEKNYLQNGEDDRKHIAIDNRRGKNTLDVEGPLSAERRKYYQDKLENLERKLHNTRTFRRRKNDDRDVPKTNDILMRRMRPNLQNLDTIRSRHKPQGDSFYMPDRARFIGY